MVSMLLSSAIFSIAAVHAFRTHLHRHSRISRPLGSTCCATTNNDAGKEDLILTKEKIVIIGAGWGGLSAAHALITSDQSAKLDITLVDASPRVGGLVRDGFRTINGTAKAEAGQHGFWDNYHNIFSLLENLPTIDKVDDILTGYAEQGQYSPRGLEAVWPVYRESKPKLPTGLAQALYTKFNNLPPLDRASAFPLVLAFSEFDDSKESWKKYDKISFRDLCIKLGVSKKCYDEAFEPMILTGLFAPGAECSAAAALGMAYFFVLRSQESFDVRWCRGNIGELIFDPWVRYLEQEGVKFETSTRVQGFEMGHANTISGIKVSKVMGDMDEKVMLDADKVVFGVGGAALSAMVRFSPQLSRYSEFRRFSNLRGTGVLATRLYLDRVVNTPYSANACWGFDEGVGMTYFDITKLHGLAVNKEDEDNGVTGSVIEVDYYHAASLLVMNDKAIVEKVKGDLDIILGAQSTDSKVVDAAIVRLPQAVNWYSPGSYANMPDAGSVSVSNAYFCGDLVRSRHGSWSQEKAFVTGIEAANIMLGREEGTGIIPLQKEEPHVALSRAALSTAKTFFGLGDKARVPYIADFLW
eukprot:CAMPEP_0172562150 /NCGR_PEP_ID=MMETSP1067-20121228/95788_1 /TAXON_ID=265564 ORGANISM="Thalassiosira punctigera, Strain Tpunct2005C2" /NCGR_SAMPLE_ID=MMETSP1067 /ASSEMBLY_ACC=CAM_ASM_000444 /LENGTH=582 /DNA_ID=CAMNT_0013352329 /DNA_START=58 /DNA_END=1803 /DNA_ORIENTATION=-